jgi:hypothetical protein
MPIVWGGGLAAILGLLGIAFIIWGALALAGIVRIPAAKAWQIIVLIVGIILFICFAIPGVVY